MYRRLSLLVVASVATLSLILSAPVSAAAPTKVFGSVGPGSTIALKDSRGKQVKTLKPGRYTFVIKDKSSIHDFNLVGPGVNKTSGIAFVGATSFTVTLKKGSYKYQCAVHLFKGTFKVA